ncbi:gag-pol polyprotein [Tanacetum coccineum]
MMKGSDIRIQEKKAKLFNEWERFTSTDRESIESYYHRFSMLMDDFKRNKHFPEKIVSNLKFLNNLQPEWRQHFTIVHQTKDLHTADYTQLYDFLKYNQKHVKIDKYRWLEAMVGISLDSMLGRILGIRMGIMQYKMLGISSSEFSSEFRCSECWKSESVIVVLGIANQNPNGNGNVVAERVEGNAIRNNGNQIRCYNCRGLGHLARKCTVRPRRMDATYC